MLRNSRMQKIEGSAPTVVNRDFGSTRSGSLVTHLLAAAGGQSLVATAQAGAQRIQVALIDDEPRNVTHGSAGARPRLRGGSGWYGSVGHPPPTPAGHRGGQLADERSGRPRALSTRAHLGNEPERTPYTRRLCCVCAAAPPIPRGNEPEARSPWTAQRYKASWRIAA